MKTKTSYELVTDLDANDIAKAMIDGEVFYSKDGAHKFSWRDGRFYGDDGIAIHVCGEFHRKVETEIDEVEDMAKLLREAFNTAAPKYNSWCDMGKKSKEGYRAMARMVLENINENIR